MLCFSSPGLEIVAQILKKNCFSGNKILLEREEATGCKLSASLEACSSQLKAWALYNKKGEGSIPFTSLRRDISPVTVWQL